MDPGAPIIIPPELTSATDAAMQAFQDARQALNQLIDAYDALPGTPKAGDESLRPRC